MIGRGWADRWHGARESYRWTGCAVPLYKLKSIYSEFLISVAVAVAERVAVADGGACFADQCYSKRDDSEIPAGAAHQSQRNGHYKLRGSRRFRIHKGSGHGLARRALIRYEHHSDR